MAKREETVKVRITSGKFWSSKIPGHEGSLTCIRPSDDNPFVVVRKSALAGLKGKVEVVDTAPKRGRKPMAHASEATDNKDAQPAPDNDGADSQAASA